MKADKERPADKEPGQEKDNVIPSTFRRLALEHAESIGQALVGKASEGHYNAAHLLLELGGIGLSGKEKPDAELNAVEPRIFLLDLVEKMLLRKDPGGIESAAQNKTQADRGGWSG